MERERLFEPGKMTVTLDLGCGSSVKGMVNSSIASRFEPDAVMCNNGTNAA